MVQLKQVGRKLWREWVKPILWVVVLMTAARSSLADWYVVPTGSMRPNIIEGDRIFVNKLAYDLRVPFAGWSVWRHGEPTRSDVVVFYAPGNGKRMVKRVIGLPGDTIEVRGNNLLVNGRLAGYEVPDAALLADPAFPPEVGKGVAIEDLAGRAHPIMTVAGPAARAVFGPVTIPPGHYFMMGDNRGGSVDSRRFGFVPRDQIIGRSSAIVISLDPDRHHLPRSKRFLRELP